MTKRPKNKVPAGLSAAAMASALAEVGHPISRRQVSKYQAQGADMSSPDAFLAWVQASEQRTPRKLKGNPGLAKLREQKITEEIGVLKLRRALDEKRLAEAEGRLVEVTRVHQDQDRCCAKAMAILCQKFETELPPKQDGMPAVKIAEMNMAALDEVCAVLMKRETYAA